MVLILIAQVAEEVGNTNVGSAETWKEFGLAGLVIFALFCLVFYVMKQGREDRATQDERHREERIEILGRFEKVAEITKESVDNNTDAIRELTRYTKERMFKDE